MDEFKCHVIYCTKEQAVALCKEAERHNISCEDFIKLKFFGNLLHQKSSKQPS